jgi:hypothetical protein
MNKPADSQRQTQWVVFDIPKDEPLLAAIGAVTLRHSQLDHALRLTIKSVAEIELAEALNATVFDGSSRLRGRINKIAKSRLGEGAALLKLQSLLERCRLATEKRNDLVHAVWYRESDNDTYMRTSGSIQKGVPTVEELKSLEREIDALAQEINDARLRGFLRDALDRK